MQGIHSVPSGAGGAPQTLAGVGGVYFLGVLVLWPPWGPGQWKGGGEEQKLRVGRRR